MTGCLGLIVTTLVRQMARPIISYTLGPADQFRNDFCMVHFHPPFSGILFLYLILRELDKSSADRLITVYLASLSQQKIVNIYLIASFSQWYLENTNFDIPY